MIVAQVQGSEPESARVRHWSYDSAGVRAFLTFALAAMICLGGPSTVRGDAPVAERVQPTADNVDGLYLMLGPLGAFSYLEGERQGIFGGNLLVLRVRERAPLATLGMAVGGLRYTVAERGRVWSEAILGARVWANHVGLGIGPVLEVDRVAPARVGGQVTAWLFLGVIPYFRAGYIDGRGPFLELGVQLMLPARSW